MTRSEFGRQLIAQVDEMRESYDPAAIAGWANDIYFHYSHEATKETRDAMEEVVVMAEGSEFEMSIDELRAYARSLINDE